MKLKRSPLAPRAFPKLPALPGVRIATGNSGTRYAGRDDVLLVLMDEGTTAAGVFTTSKTRSAPVDWCRTMLERGKGRARALVVNAGNANAFTGAAGMKTVEQTTEAAAALAGAGPEEVFVSSTGTIGETLDGAAIAACLADMAGRAKATQTVWRAAAKAIMTTDTYPKAATATADIDGVPVTVCGIAKGSGMIAPDMATMLAYVFTDAAIAPAALQKLLSKGADKSFNAITVDSDTSTSDTLMAFATGKAGHKPVKKAGDKRLKDFRKALEAVLLDLAHQVVRDGEGARKFVTINVTGAKTKKAARRIGLAVANSPLVKTAIAGEDANWGRIVMAVGKSGEEADRDRLTVSVGGIAIATKGQPVEGYDETPVAAHMKGREIVVDIDLGLGKGASTVWTCDLTHAYIDINADYRT